MVFPLRPAQVRTALCPFRRIPEASFRILMFIRFLYYRLSVLIGNLLLQQHRQQRQRPLQNNGLLADMLFALSKPVISRRIQLSPSPDRSVRKSLTAILL